MTPGELARLRAEIRSDRAAFEARVDELAGLPDASASPATSAQVAVALHHAYGAVEAALMRVARAVEGGVPPGAEWHQQLLAAMALELPGVRPAVLSAATVVGLRRMLAFRHFFRRAYAVAWDPAQLDTLRAVALAVRAPLAADLDALDAFLADLGAALAR